MLNFLTWSKAYAAFPLSTFVHRHGVAFGNLDEFFQSHAEKYQNRNFPISELHSQGPRRSTSELAEIRRLGDRLTWKIPFDTTDIEPPKKHDYVLEASYSRFQHKDSSTSSTLGRLTYALTVETYIPQH